ncbi:MAG: hypothetical protein Q8P41_11040 [Pseudomonadota bacterium]|nr:hypothetical protein [Pseudomonadota bacterium]
MQTCLYTGDVAGLARSHPYTHAVSNEAFRYLDLRATPGLIRTSLEDFVPWSGYDAVEQFYLLLEGLNGPDSTLETNDCAFSAPEDDPEAPLERQFMCSGRVMVLFRHLPRNTSASDWGTFTNALHVALSRTDPHFELGVIGTALVPVQFSDLPPAAREGHQLMVSFWAWGRTERVCMENLARLMTNLAGALREVDGR